MNNVKIFHCLKCHESLAKFGEGPLSLYIQFCEFYIANDFQALLIDSSHNPSFRTIHTFIKFLEKKGYVITTDASDIDPTLIKLVPQGIFQIADDLYEFCPRNCIPG